MTDPARLLALYDEQLRTDAETPSALAVTAHGPLRLVTFPGGSGFVTYRDLGGADAAAIGELVSQALAHFRADPTITRVEWKARGHDHAPGLHEALTAHGFTPDEPESIMIGEARALAVDVPLPDGVTLRQVTEEADVRAMSADGGRGVRRPGLRRHGRCPAAPAVAARTGWSCGSPRRRAGSSAPGGSSRCPAPTSPASGAARRGRSGAGGGSTAP